MKGLWQNSGRLSFQVSLSTEKIFSTVMEFNQHRSITEVLAGVGLSRLSRLGIIALLHLFPRNPTIFHCRWLIYRIQRGDSINVTCLSQL